MQKRLTSSLRLLAAAVAAVSLTGSAQAATYELTNAVSVPFTSTDGTAAATSTTYTTLNLASVSRSTLPNGGFGPLMIGTASGRTNDANNASINTAFAYDPVNGFRLVGLYTSTSNGIHVNTNVRGFNGVGQVIGASPINSASSTDQNGILGQEAWLYSTAGNSNIALGLTGANFSYTKQVPMNGTVTPVAFSGNFRSSSPSFVNNPGQVVGSTNRFAGDSATAPSTNLGASTWLYTPGGATDEIGLFGPNYSYNFVATTGSTSGRFSSNGVLGLTQTGYVIGFATPYSDLGNGTTGAGLGTDGWVRNGPNTTAIGLYARGTTPVVPGFESIPFKYHFTPSGTVGSTPMTSQNRSTTLVGVNAAGQVIGTSQYYNGGPGPTGTDAFVYSTSGDSYRQLGFTANGFTSTTPPAGSSSFVNTTGGRSSAVAYISNAGKIVGTSTQYRYYSGTNGASTFASGTVAWVDSGAGPTRIGLFGQAGDTNASKHINPQTGISQSSISALTESGFVGGFSNRYFLNASNVGAGLGQDAWVYDSNTDTIYTVDQVNAAGSNFTTSTISYLSELGYAVGQYAVSASTSSSSSFKAFLWSIDGGFVDLGASLAPGLNTTDYQNLITAFYSSPDGSTLYATGALKTATSSTTVGGLVVLFNVPEPTSMALLGLGGLAILRRRTRRS